jgi:hypothetical protein
LWNAVCLSNLWGGRGDDLSPQSASRHPLKDPEKGINLYNRRVWNKMRQDEARNSLAIITAAVRTTGKADHKP